MTTASNVPYASTNTLSHQFSKEYWMEGKGSCYKNFHYMPDKAVPRALAFVQSSNVPKGARVLDYGCGMGPLVAALQALDYDATGVDISEWPIANCVPEAKGHVQLLGKRGLQVFKDDSFDLVIAKDVFEHIPKATLPGLADELLRIAPKLIFLSPIADRERKFVCAHNEDDETHITRLTQEEWLRLFPKQRASLHDRVTRIARGSEEAHGSICVLLERGMPL